MSRNKTPQEAFWDGEFGTDYINRNNSDALLSSNLGFFSKALRNTRGLSSCVEFGANIGMNLRALRHLFPLIDLSAIEINPHAAEELIKLLGKQNVMCSTLLEAPISTQCDLSLIKGVLIHINPEDLEGVYNKLYQASKRYILIAEYYNSTPVSIPYRGHSDKLFKRDFAGEILDQFSDLRLVDYGFVWHRDNLFPQDDISWFLLEKQSS